MNERNFRKSVKPRSSGGRVHSRGRVLAAAVVLLVIAALAAVVFTIARLQTPTQPVPGPGPAPAPPPPIAAPAPEHVTEEDVRENNRAVGIMGRYEYDRAREIFAGLLARHRDWLDVRVNLAIATLNRQQPGDEEAALVTLRGVLDNDPRHLRAQYVKGILLLYRGERDEAMAHLTAVAERDPADAHAAYFIATIHAGRGEHEDAVRWFDRAIARDSYLRSAYYGKSRSLFALGRDDQADEQFEVFQRLEPNPRAHTAEFIYTRMGPKAMAQPVDLDPTPPPPPQGPIFDEVVPLLINADRFTWRELEADHPVSITVADISGDGRLDLFIPGVLDQPGLYNAVCMNIGERGYVLEADHALARIPDVNAALWGDVDNDGLTDVYLCRRGPNMLLHQSRRGVWRDITEMTGTAGGNSNTVSGLLFDADHDGDLDIFLVNEDGPNELLNNNRDGSFTPIAQRQGIAGDGRPSRQVIAVDLERDRDLDIMVIKNEPPHEVYLNDRLWQYRRQGGGSPFERFIAADIVAAVAGDLDADGRAELYTLDSQGDMHQWRFNERGVLVGLPVAAHRADRRDDDEEEGDDEPKFSPPQIAIADVNGDARQEVVASRGAAWAAISMKENEIMASADDGAHLAGWALLGLEVARGPAVVGMPAGGGHPMIWRPGPGRHRFAALAFTGMDDPGHALRSNASGIGTHYAARIGSHWVAGSTLPKHSGPGQSLQPIGVGLAGHPRIDFVAIDWSDGVFQSEIDLAAGQLHTITETQRQLASCPILFAWNGEKFEFASDVLGVGGIGFAIGPGEYAESRPWEYYLFPEDMLQPKDGRYIIKIGEPMEEALYLDTAALVAYDLPPGWSMTVDERMGINDPQPTGEPVFYRRSMLPVRAFNDRGEDVTTIVREQDYRAAPPGDFDLRFIGRLKDEHVLTIEFEHAIDIDRAKAQGLPSMGALAQPWLVADGWIEYPYSQTAFAAWQAGADYRAPTLEARDPATGEWRVVLEQFGYPAGFARQMAVPIPVESLPAGTRELRLRTNQEIYWDRLMIVYAEDPPADLTVHELVMVRAEVKRTGFAQRVLFDQRRAYYDYDNRHPLWDTRHQTGYYTRFGDVLEIIGDRNDALAIIGPGEEIHIEFAPHPRTADVGSDERSEEDPDRSGASAPTPLTDFPIPRIDSSDFISGDAASSLPPTPPGWTRRFVIELRGWCKDMDLYTKEGETIDPLPTAGGDSPERERLHREFNTRYRSGR